jgi:hypothetical protein
MADQFSLPIQVEGREDNEEVEAQMDVDELMTM